jgi:DNA polymerase gamma 1
VQSVAFFSAVDVDFLLRKEVDDPCVTPSQPDGIREQGQSCTIYDTLKETDGNMGNVAWKPLDNTASTSNHTVSDPLNMLSHCRNGAEMREWLRVQMARDKQELYKILNEQARS